MCIELPGRIVEIDPSRPGLARVDVGGAVKTIHLGMLSGDPPNVGDWLALHLGFAIERISEEQAAEALSYAENDPFGEVFGIQSSSSVGSPPASAAALITSEWELPRRSGRSRDA